MQPKRYEMKWGIPRPPPGHAVMMQSPRNPIEDQISKNEACR